MPRKQIKRYPPMEEKYVKAIARKAEGVSEWRRLEAYTLVLPSSCSGLRPKEMRLARVNDLDASQWIMTVVHPKGDDSWAEERRTPILEMARPTIKRYLASKRCPLNEAIFPALSDPGDGYLSSNSIRDLKAIVEEEVDFNFDLRSCLRTLAQMLIDREVSAESTSVFMGHKTTETYYARKKEDGPLEELRSVWNRSESIKCKNTLIETR